MPRLQPVYMLAAGVLGISTFLVLALEKNKPALYAMTILAGIWNQCYFSVLMPWRSQSINGSASQRYKTA